MLNIQRFVFNPFMENTYLIWDDYSKNAAIIDPGCFNKTENEKVKSFIQRNKLNLLYLINTHCHIDHIFGNAFIKETFDCKFIAPELDVFLLDMMIDQASNYGVDFTPSPKPDEFISEDIELEIGLFDGTFIFTPGHSPGGYSLYFEEPQICFTGDTLFKENIGRTDLWGGDYDQLIDSIKNKILVLPPEVKIFPGHENSSTIGNEIMNNPFLKNDGQF